MLFTGGTGNGMHFLGLVTLTIQSNMQVIQCPFYSLHDKQVLEQFKHYPCQSL